MAEFIKGSSYFGTVLSLGAYMLAWFLKKKTKLTVFNPILIAIALTIGVLLILGIDYQSYYSSAKTLSWLLTPATVCLAIPLYEQIQMLKRNLRAIIAGITAGTIASIGSIALITWICGLSSAEFATMLPKSVTTAISMQLSQALGGNGAITAVLVIFTGVMGNLSAEWFLKLIRVTEPAARGVAIGTASHAIGTSRAMEMGPVEGAMSSLSIAVAGVITVAFASFIAQFM